MPKIEATPSDKPQAPAKKTRTVSEWRDVKFPTIELNKVKRQNPDLWKHGAAASLHCWAEHAHHEAKEMELSESAYDAAIKAVCSAPPYKPHKAALSKHAKLKEPK